MRVGREGAEKNECKFKFKCKFKWGEVEEEGRLRREAGRGGEFFGKMLLTVGRGPLMCTPARVTGWLASRKKTSRI